MAPTFADRTVLQDRLFAGLSAMFAREAPLYGRSLEVNAAVNRAACALVGRLHRGFAVTDDRLARTGGERHGAIRIGRPDEFRWVARFFGAFGMEPHNFYDMTAIGSRSQPVIATAFRSVLRPEHRVFASLLVTDYFDAATRARIEALLSLRQVFSDRARELVERSERQGGLDLADGDALVREGVERIFAWTGRANDLKLFRELSDAGFRIAADIACSRTHHLNHLTPNTLLMDLYVASMKHCLGELDAGAFRGAATGALERLAGQADRDWLRLHFKHLSHAEIDSFQPGSVSVAEVAELVDGLAATFRGERFRLSGLPNSGFKDFTEGPSGDTPVLLRQDAYRAVTEPVEFTEPDGSTVIAPYTARFGEIEQRFYACTPAGRTLYDRCLAEAEAARERDPGLATRDRAAYERAHAAAFLPFPKSLPELVAQGLVFARFAPTPAGESAAARGTVPTTDLVQLARAGLVTCEGLRYEDFLPVSAAGIFASNLSQYGTASTAAVRPTYSKQVLEEVMGRRIVEASLAYAGIDAASRLDTWSALGVIDRVPAIERAAFEAAVAACPAEVLREARDPRAAVAV